MSRFPRHGFPGGSLPWWRRLRFHDVLLLTAVPLAALLYLLWLSVSAVQRARLYGDATAGAVGFEDDFLSRTRLLRNTPALLMGRLRFEEAPDDPAVIHLLVPQDRWAEVVRSPWTGFDVWEDGTLDHDGTLEPVRYRRRGDNSVHWLTPKVSLTLRTSRETLFRGYRSFGLSTKDVLTQYVTNRLPREAGLLAPRTDLAPVFVNRKFYGMFRVLETVDESMLRLAGRMPGNLFRGDAAERGEYYKHLPRSLFRNVPIWERVAQNDRPSGPPPDAMRRFLEDLNGTSFEAHQRLMAWIDRDEMARLLAVMLIVGDPIHMDNVHNQYWYEDPATGRLHLIPWDLRLWPLDRPHLPLNEFWQKALRNPFLVDATLSEARRLLDDEGLLARADTLAREAWERFAPYLDWDRMRGGVIAPVGDPAEINAGLARNAAILRDWMHDARFAVAAGPVEAGVRVLDLVSLGMTGGDLVGLHVAGDAARPRLRRDANGNGVPDASDPLVPGVWTRDGAGWAFRLDVPLPLLPGWDTERREIAPAQVAYRFFVEAAGPGAIEAEVHNRRTGAPASRSPLALDAPLFPSGSWHPWQYPNHSLPRPRTWSGTVRVAETLRLGPVDTLRILPGTTVLLDPEVSLIARGPVLADGTAERPIRILRTDPGRPWGTIALQGPGASNSRFRHVEFRGGGGALVDRVEYIGAVNVHRATGVTFERALFADNVRSDDMLHVLDGDASVRHSRIERANSDAIDYDNATGVLADNVIEGSGGDGIDLMASRPVIVGNRITGSGDKAISVGEASSPVLGGNVLAGGLRGIEVKDGSAPLVLGNMITGNRVGVRIDRKNWRYGEGGWPVLLGTVNQDNVVPLEMDSVSRLTVDAGYGAPGMLKTLAAAHGVTWDGGAGVAAVWSTVEPRVPRLDWRFPDDFAPLTPWWRSGGGERLLRRDAALVLAIRKTPGDLRRPVDWVVPPGAGWLLVLDVGGADLTAIEVTVTGDTDSVTRRVVPQVNPRVHQLVALSLPPGRYTELRLTGSPHPGLERVQPTTGFIDIRRAHLRVRRVLLFETVVP